MPSEIQLRPNVPVQLALLSPEGELDSGIAYFQTNGGILAVSERVAEKINALGLRIGESFSICKYTRAAGVEYCVGLAVDSERGRAIEEAEDPDSLAPLLQRSIDRARRPERFEVVETPRRKPIARAERPQVETRGTGTDGPAPQPAKAPPKPVFSPIPYNVAFREITQFVTAELKATGEQWADQAKQDLISTVIISAQKQGLLKVWEREG